jgi:hypothetical protein
MTLFKLDFIVQLDKKNVINLEWAGNFKEAFVAYPRPQKDGRKLRKYVGQESR